MPVKIYFVVFVLIVTNSFCNANSVNANKETISKDTILKIDMELSAFGVESDDFPSISASINFIEKTSSCKKSFYNPKHKASEYSLTSDEFTKLLKLLEKTDFAKLKKKYSVGKTDQPTSTITIYTKHQKIVIQDYGLEGDNPLPEIYNLVYKL
jgi:hypothetical protein